MKSLIKLIFLVFFLSIGKESFTQNFGIRAGLNLSEIHLSNPYYNYNDYLKMNSGFHIGPTVEFPITESFSIESGLLLSTKGRKLIIKEPNMDNYISKEKVNMFYLDIPIAVKATFEIGVLKIYGNFGPYIGMGLGGKIIAEFTDGIPTHKENIKFGTDASENQFKRLDYGLMAGGGIVVNDIQVGINYVLGLANISNTSDFFQGSEQYNRVWCISAGYSF